MHPLIQQHREAIVELAKKRGLSKVRVFGSMARGDAIDASDADLLVTAGPTASGFDVGGFLMAVQEPVGRKVDVVNLSTRREARTQRRCGTMSPGKVSDRTLLEAMLGNAQYV